jgi:hypothetical protein
MIEKRRLNRSDAVDWLSIYFYFARPFCDEPPLAIANPFAGIDHSVALWSLI